MDRYQLTKTCKDNSKYIINMMNNNKEKPGMTCMDDIRVYMLDSKGGRMELVT